MKTTIAIPVFNEEKTIQKTINQVKKLKIEKQIIVVDDGSTDNSYKKLKKIPGIKLLKHEKNKGKGAAVKTALKKATGDIFIIQDADLELNPKEIPKLTKPIINKKTGVVYGSRNRDKKDKNRYLLFYLGGVFITKLTNFLYKTNLTDVVCGFKAFKINIIKDIKINENRFEWEVEVTAKIAKQKIPIFEVPVNVNSRSIKEGKKLTALDGIKTALALIKYKFK